MTEPTDAWLEAAGRALCARLGLDPDEKVGHDIDLAPGFSGFVPDVLLYSPQWSRMALMMKHQWHLREAAAEADRLMAER